MNERIKLLSKQAGDYVNETYTGPVRSKTPGKIWEDGHVGWHTQFNEKFAELIVRECLDIASEVRGDEPAAATHYVIGYDRACEKMISGIKQHFGVKE